MDPNVAVEGCYNEDGREGEGVSFLGVASKQIEKFKAMTFRQMSVTSD